MTNKTFDEGSDCTAVTWEQIALLGQLGDGSWQRLQTRKHFVQSTLLYLLGFQIIKEERLEGLYYLKERIHIFVLFLNRKVRVDFSQFDASRLEQSWLLLLDGSRLEGWSSREEKSRFEIFKPPLYSLKGGVRMTIRLFQRQWVPGLKRGTWP